MQSGSHGGGILAADGFIEEPGVELARPWADHDAVAVVTAEGVGAAGVLELVDQQGVDRLHGLIGSG